MDDIELTPVNVLLMAPGTILVVCIAPFVLTFMLPLTLFTMAAGAMYRGLNQDTIE